MLINKNRILVLIVLGAVVLTFGFISTRLHAQQPSLAAYQACRRVMLKTEGYGIWKLKNSQYGIFEARFEFTDGWNTTNCIANGFGSIWLATRTLQTTVKCMQSLSAPNDVECPRQKFGITP